MTHAADRLRLCDWAVQYYVAGRLAARSGLAPICGNLFHHAIEMCLKAALVDVMSLREMRSKEYESGHGLTKFWERFKLKVADPALDRFDKMVHALHEFEDLRYPDRIKDGQILMAITWHPSDAILSSGVSTVQRYEFFISEIDELVIEMLDRLSLNPKLVLGARGGQAALGYRNAHATRWGLGQPAPDDIES